MRKNRYIHIKRKNHLFALLQVLEGIIPTNRPTHSGRSQNSLSLSVRFVRSLRWLVSRGFFPIVWSFIEGELVYKGVIASAVHESDSVLHVNTSILLQVHDHPALGREFSMPHSRSPLASRSLCRVSLYPRRWLPVPVGSLSSLEGLGSFPCRWRDHRHRVPDA